MYRTIAQYYDLIHADLVEDIRFFLKTAGPVGGQLLELGCGTGRLLIPLARSGYTLTGVDRSPDMLALAREKIAAGGKAVAEKVSLIEANAIDFRLDKRFDTAIFSHNTFMHLGRHDLRLALTNIRQHLSRTGKLIIDVDNPVEMADTSIDHLMVLERTINIPNTREILVQTASSWVDHEKQVRNIIWIFERSSKDSGQVIRDVIQAAFHYHYAHQLELHLRGAGFALTSLHGDYDSSPYSDFSPRMIVIAYANG